MRRSAPAALVALVALAVFAGTGSPALAEDPGFAAPEPPSGVNAAVAERADGHPAPDSAEIAQLRAHIGPRVIRVRCDAGTFTFGRVVLDAEGVQSDDPRASRPPRAALFEGAGVPAVATPWPIPWSSIGTIEVGRSRWRDGFKAGFIVFGIALAGYYPLLWAVSASQAGSSVPYVLGAAGVVVGTATAIAAPDKRWTVVYVRR